MKRAMSLILPEKVINELQRHLFPGDGLEAAALLLCTQVGSRRKKLLGREVITVPHSHCVRRPDFITWPGEYVEKAIDIAALRNEVVIAVHSHPGGLFTFSTADDKSDEILMNALQQGTDQIAGSAIMVQSGAMRARTYENSQAAIPIDLVMAVGTEIHTWWNVDTMTIGSEPPPMAFTSEMRKWLSRMSICIVGVSGTGSIVAEQLARLGVGEIILIDFDKLEEKNLNRILNSSYADLGTYKVEMFANAIRRYHPNCEVVALPSSLTARETILAAAEADLLFSCVDTAEGRHIADRVAAYFALPLFDVGVSIPTEPTKTKGRRITEVYGRIDYVYPGGSSLMDRGVYNARLLEAEYLARVAPEALTQKIADGYLHGMTEEAPGVITLNMRAASACVMEMIARLFPFRDFPNEARARSIFMLAEGDEDIFAEKQFTVSSQFPVACGATEPLLGLPALAQRRVI